MPDSFTFGKKNLPEADRTDGIDRALEGLDGTQKQSVLIQDNNETFGKPAGDGASHKKDEEVLDAAKVETRDDGFDTNQETLNQTEKEQLASSILKN